MTHLHAVDERLDGKWFVEAGFGPSDKVVPPIIDSPDEAQRWVFEGFSRQMGSLSA